VIAPHAIVMLKPRESAAWKLFSAHEARPPTGHAYRERLLNDPEQEFRRNSRQGTPALVIVIGSAVRRRLWAYRGISQMFCGWAKP